VTPPQTAQQQTQHQGAAHQVPFNLDGAPTDIGPVHVHFNDLGDPYDPAAAEANPPPASPAPQLAAAVHDCFGDSASSSSDEAHMDDTLSFVKGSATTAMCTSSPMTCCASFAVGAKPPTA